MKTIDDVVNQPTPSPEFQHKQVAVVSAAHFSHDVYSSFLAPLMPLLIDRFGLSLSMVALLDITRKVPSLLNPFVGLMADRMCVKAMVIAAPAVTAVCMSLLGVMPSFPLLLILLLITGVSSTFFHVPTPVVIRSLSGDSSGRGMSYYMLGGELARTMGPLLITAAISMWGLEGSVRVMPLGLVASALLYRRLRHLKPMARRTPKSQEGSSINALRKLAPLLCLLGGFMLFRFGIKLALTLYLPTYLTSVGRTLWVGGIAVSLLQFSGAVGTLGAGYVADRFGHRRTLIVIAAITPLTALGLTYASSMFVIPLLLATGFLLFASGPILLAMIQDTAQERPAFINGVFMTLSLVLSSIAVYGVGTLGDQIGLTTTFRVCAGLSLVSLPFAVALPGMRLFK
jgi:MFS transporter, FSR family, fosmidomycin resistance protein